MAHTSSSAVEQQKRLYSSQLAAHTLRQWNAVRQQVTPERRSKSPNLPQSGTDRDRQEQENYHDESNGQLTPTGRQRSYRQAVNGHKVVDFAARQDPSKHSDRTPDASNHLEHE